MPVLEQWNLEIPSGERLAFLGPSGCGKTTFLRMIAGLESPTRGIIRMEYQKVGYVFQEPRLIPWKSVKDNLLFACPNGPYREILAQLGLLDFASYYPAQLSGGMCQRVNLARALISQPDLLILDEAFLSLDYATKFKIMKEIVQLWQTIKFTLVAVTHDPKEALLLADRVVLLSERPARILKEYNVGLGEPRSFTSPEFLKAEAELIAMITKSPCLG